ncbi:MAG: alkaline phosphatase family protein, partial [Chloroflexi bacterium]|nr:alkaline phosphatase family protein [Chloroflexota bacterium]
MADSRARPRVLIIGLDSAPLPWVRKWAGEGRLPNLSRLMERGAAGILRTVNPPLTPAAWSSLATGMVPAKHGIYDHIYRRPESYDIAPTNSRLRAARPVWQIISEHGGQVGVVNVPETYPPMAVNGFLISGMDTPSDEVEWANPPALKAELERALGDGGYKVFGVRSKESLDRSIAGMHQTIPMRARAGKYLWETHRPDFMIHVFMESDVIQHKCWKYMDPAHPDYRPGSPYTDTIPDIYARIDAAIGPWLDSLDYERTTVIVMSDHGAGPLNKWLYLNNWLVREGYMRFKPSALARLKHAAFRLGFTPENAFNLAARLGLGLVDRVTDNIKNEMGQKERTTLVQRLFLSWRDVDWARTRAYSLGGNFTGYYVNLRGREPQGCVEPGAEYEALRAEMADRLARWRDPQTGRPLVERAYRREELHNGPFAERAPDVIFATPGEAYVGFGGHEFAGNQLVGPSNLFNGHHRMDGLILLAGRGVQPGAPGMQRIVDVAPTVLHLLGYPVPEDMDGRVMA